jgi:predicted PurR-regulated permease PerM
MENKSLFAAISLTIVLISGFFFYNNQVSQLEDEITSITTEYNSKISAVQSTPNIENKANTSILEDLNNQLITARSALQEAQQKLTLATSKSSVLDSEISQINDARGEVKVLKGSLENTQQKLQISGEKIDYLKGIFETQNKATVVKNMARIDELKETSTSIAVTGLIVPAIGVVTLISYTTEEIDNYCANIKNTIDLEKKVFNKVVSLDTQMQDNYHQQCEVSLKDKVKKVLKKLQTAKK